MTWVKVCGLSRSEEVDAAVASGADAVGFVSVPGSPRYLGYERVAELADSVPVLRFLLTSDLEPEELLEVADRCRVNGLQPYGRGAAAAARAAVAAGFMVLQPISLGGEEEEPEAIAGAVPLFDTHRPGRSGGTGERFDWSLLDRRQGEFVVAGGLEPGNVGELIGRIDPWGVDASSGLESAPGVKDLGKVAAFVEEAKRR